MACGSSIPEEAGGRSGLMVLQEENVMSKMKMGNMYFENINKVQVEFK
jgi:hypothetical protein